MCFTYTSGTTGKSKGVVQTHRAIIGASGEPTNMIAGRMMIICFPICQWLGLEIS